MFRNDIHPFEGVGKLQFGMVPEEVRFHVGCEYKSFKRTPVSEFPCDHFLAEGLFAYYTAKGTLEALEFSQTASVWWHGLDLLQTPVSKIRGLLEAQDKQLEFEMDGVTSFDLGIGVYAPSVVEDPDGFPESVIVFKEGYYD